MTFIRAPMRSYVLSAFEGLAGFAALQLYAEGNERWGLTVMILTLLFVYTDGACGWSVRRNTP